MYINMENNNINKNGSKLIEIILQVLNNDFGYTTHYTDAFKCI